MFFFLFAVAKSCLGLIYDTIAGGFSAQSGINNSQVHELHTFQRELSEKQLSRKKKLTL